MLILGMEILFENVQCINMLSFQQNEGEKNNLPSIVAEEALDKIFSTFMALKVSILDMDEYFLRITECPSETKRQHHV